MNPDDILDLMINDIERVTSETHIGIQISYVIKRDDATTVIIDYSRSLTLVELKSSFVIEFDHQLDVLRIRNHCQNSEDYRGVDISSIESKEMITKMIVFLSLIELVFPDSESIRYIDGLKSAL